MATGQEPASAEGAFVDAEKNIVDDATEAGPPKDPPEDDEEGGEDERTIVQKVKDAFEALPPKYKSWILGILGATTVAGTVALTGELDRHWYEQREEKRRAEKEERKRKERNKRQRDKRSAVHSARRLYAGTRGLTLSALRKANVLSSPSEDED